MKTILHFLKVEEGTSQVLEMLKKLKEEAITDAGKRQLLTFTIRGFSGLLILPAN